MDCFVCRALMVPAFTKAFADENLGMVQYVSCSQCGLIISETHYGMTDKGWGDLNHEYHDHYFGTDDNPDDALWLTRLQHQKRAIATLAFSGMFGSKAIDYGAGDGKLADALANEGLPVSKYDKFMPGTEGYLQDEDLKPSSFDLVINTSVFEHVRGRDTLDEIASLVSPDGTMALHTWISSNIPRDPSWFYLLPVHTTFFSAEAVKRLMEGWGFKSCIYHIPGMMWFFSKRPFSTLSVPKGREWIASEGGVPVPPSPRLLWRAARVILRSLGRK